MSTSSSSSSALLSYLPTILLLPVAYGLWKFSSPPPSSTSSSSEPSTTAGKASKKKKKKTTPAAAKEEQPPVMEEKKRVQQQPAPKVQEKAALPPPAPTVAEVVKNGKGKKKSNKLKALAAAEEGKGKPLAEVHAEREAKRQGKSGVEDMLPPVHPPARVMKISSSTAYEAAPARVADPSPPPSSMSDSDDEPAQPLEQEEKAAPSLNISSDYGWEEAPGAEEEAWETIPVKGKAKKPLNNPLASTSSKATETAAALSAASAKKTRQNAARAEAKKAAKQDSEADRLRVLAAHKRGLEKARIEELYKKGLKNSIGGGMKATVSETGKLVWE